MKKQLNIILKKKTFRTFNFNESKFAKQVELKIDDESNTLDFMTIAQIMDLSTEIAAPIYIQFTEENRKSK